MAKLPPQPPLKGRVIVATIAVLLGGYVTYDAGKDFQFIKFEPHSAEEIERRKKEKVGLSIKHLETRTLDYTDEAKARMKQLIEEKKENNETINDIKNSGNKDV